MKKKYLTFYIIIFVCLNLISCINKDNSAECSNFLYCLDGSYWTNNDNQSIWTFNNDPNGKYLEVYISGNKCYTYENNFMVNAKFIYQTKTNLSEHFDGSNWSYSILNDSVIKKSKSTGGNTTYFNKIDKSYLDDLLDFDECN